MNKENFDNLTPTEIRFKIQQKTKARADLSLWLSKHTANEAEYKHVVDDRQELLQYIQKLEKMLKGLPVKTFNASLNEEAGVEL